MFSAATLQQYHEIEQHTLNKLSANAPPDPAKHTSDTYQVEEERTSRAALLPKRVKTESDGSAVPVDDTKCPLSPTSFTHISWLTGKDTQSLEENILYTSKRPMNPLYDAIGYHRDHGYIFQFFDRSDGKHPMKTSGIPSVMALLNPKVNTIDFVPVIPVGKEAVLFAPHPGPPDKNTPSEDMFDHVALPFDKWNYYTLELQVVNNDQSPYIWLIPV
ncbi:hypothetical protein C8J57DRAFT_1499179 [Mycena rebaudengoi]|nr:hypothetical protein C8J57DRAFT_1546609 [Mycena rebaudengoi]KAJ7284206.1 hypothetical protein C8J57DRAFT_1499179 [Mycena rebaudengoi]